MSFESPPMRTLASLAFCAALDAADLAMIPGMFRAFESDFGVSLSDIGIMYLLQCLVSALAMPIWGGLGDRMSRKTLLCFGCFCWGGFTIACAFAGTFVEFTVFRTCAAIFLSLVSPIAQSVVADLAPSEGRGRVFGKIGFVAMLGAFVGQFASTVTAEQYYGGVRGWRICLAAVGGLSVAFPFFMSFLMIEPQRSPQARAILDKSEFGVDWESLKLKSFWLLCLQGVFGCIPWRAFGMFSILWLELLGYSSMQTAIMGGFGMAAGAVGHLIAGYIGDFAHAMYPYRGRIYVAQTTVSSGMILVFILLMVLPKSPNHIVLFCTVIVLFNLTSSWASNATNRPLVADIVPEWSRASIYSYFTMLESVPSSFAGYLVSYIAESGFGFTAGTGPGKRVDVNNLSDAEKAHNVTALTNALCIMTLVPWTLTFVIYSLMHFTYEKDVTKSTGRQKRAKLFSDDFPSSTEEGNGVDDGTLGDLDEVQLLAEGRRG